MLAFPNIKIHGNSQIGKKGCRHRQALSAKLADIVILARHVADMLVTYTTKPICPSAAYQEAEKLCIHMTWMWDALQVGLEHQP